MLFRPERGEGAGEGEGGEEGARPELATGLPRRADLTLGAVRHRHRAQLRACHPVAPRRPDTHSRRIVSTEPRTAPSPGTERRRPSSVADLATRWASDRRLPDVLAAGAMLLSGAVLLHFLSRITFWHDEWNLLLHRRGWSVGTFLDPVVEHLVAIPILIYKLLLEVRA